MSVPAAAISDNYERIAERVASACRQHHRPVGEVTLVAVSKKHSTEAIAAAYDAGARDFGENYVQELLEKKRLLAERCPKARWHFIGRVQRNKAPQLVSCALVHGAGKLAHLTALGKSGRVQVLLQVNISAESSKGGFEIGMLRERALYASDRGCHVKGLMCIPAMGDESAFERLRLLRDDLQSELGVSLPWLSMGMTRDFESAIAAGATHVRVGTAIFGPRPE